MAWSVVILVTLPHHRALNMLDIYDQNGFEVYTENSIPYLDVPGIIDRASNVVFACDYFDFFDFYNQICLVTDRSEIVLLDDQLEGIKRALITKGITSADVFSYDGNYLKLKQEILPFATRVIPCDRLTLKEIKNILHDSIVSSVKKRPILILNVSFKGEGESYDIVFDLTSAMFPDEENYDVLFRELLREIRFRAFTFMAQKVVKVFVKVNRLSPNIEGIFTALIQELRDEFDISYNFFKERIDV